MAMSDRKNGEPPSEFMSHVAAMSWAATRQPETRLAIDSCINIKTRFLNTNHTDVLSCIGSHAIELRRTPSAIDQVAAPGIMRHLSYSRRKAVRSSYSKRALRN